jgi:hypothetical protein
MTTIDMSSEVELGLTTFMDRLMGWLVAQPEWPLLLGTDRQLRRKAAGDLAKMVLTIPPVRYTEVRPNRAQLRRFVKQFSKEYKQALLKEVEDDVRRIAANTGPAVPTDDEDGVRAVLPDGGWPHQGGGHDG